MTYSETSSPDMDTNHDDNQKFKVDTMIKNLFMQHTPNEIYSAIVRITESSDNELITNHTAFSALHKAVEAQDKYLSKLTEINNDNRDTISRYEVQIQNFQQVKSSFIYRILDFEEQISDLKNKFLLVNTERDKLTSQLVEANKQTSTIKSDIAKSKSVLKDRMNTLSANRNKLSKMDVSVKEDEDALANLLLTRDTITHEINVINQKISILRHDMVNANERLQEMTNEHDLLNEKVVSKQSLLSDANRDLVAKNEECIKLQCEVATTNAEMQRIKNELQSISSKVTTTNELIHREENTLMTLSMDLSAKNNQLGSLSYKLEMIRHDYNSVNKELNEKTNKLKDVLGQISIIDDKLQRAEKILSHMYLQLAETHAESAHARNKERYFRNKIIKDVINNM